MDNERLILLQFSEVLRLLKKFPKYRIKFQRLGWNGTDMYITLQNPDENSKITVPYLYMKTANGDLVPWCPSQTDILSDDWVQLTLITEEMVQKYSDKNE